MKKFYSFLILLVLLTSIVLTSCGSDSKYDAEIGETEDMVATDSAGTSSNTNLTPQSAKIIRDFVLKGETKEFDNAISVIQTKINENGGYIEKSEIYGGESLFNNRKTSKTANLVIRIPAEKLDSFLDQTQGVLNITNKTETTKDITLDYYDVKSRLETLETKKVALEAMLEKAESLDDLLKIQDSLYEVIADIEAYQSKLNLFDNKVNYSTITLTIQEVVEYTETEELSFGKRVVNAFKNSWTNFGEFCLDFIVFFISAIPTLLVLGLIAFIVLIIVKKVKQSKNK